jgi:hypothetical protein
MEVVDLIHNSAGTSAMRMNNPLERKLRDAHGCATHRWVSHSLYTDLGRILLGGEPTADPPAPACRCRPDRRLTRRSERHAMPTERRQPRYAVA